jgi:hypothetical protein
MVVKEGTSNALALPYYTTKEQQSREMNKENQRFKNRK